MKHTINLFLLIFAIVQVGLAQTSFTPYTELGARFGVLSSGNYFVGETKATPFIGTSMGFRVLYQEEKHFGILTEINYNQLSLSNQDGNFAIDYIQVPFLSHLNFPIKNLSLSVNFGPYGIFLLTKDPSVYLQRSFLYGLMGGFAVNYSIKHFVVSAESRYYFNLPSNNLDDETMRNKWPEISISLSYRINSKSKSTR